MQKIQTEPLPINEFEQKTYDNMWDSEYLALLMANVIKNNPQALSEYAFNRVDRILTELAKLEMN